MSLLLHIAQSERGAEKLLEINCLAKLSELKIFNNRPEDMIDYGKIFLFQMNSQH